MGLLFCQKSTRMQGHEHAPTGKFVGGWIRKLAGRGRVRAGSGGLGGGTG